ncbi:flagellar protein FlaG [Pararhizobium sp. IMCC21322]|uniref:flagellar protein FlaG n=1 Tax=Pararhizobium sp. IMCC21322 TaxID=3067903 RepID=UPI0027416D19|nr:flagellar protein FlaG [Pararhizobium sp. IMCC21322]
MDISSSIVGAPPPLAVTTPAKAPARESVPPVETETSRPKSVPAETAADKAGERRDDKTAAKADRDSIGQEKSFNSEANRPQVDRLFEVEPETETLVYKAVDPDDGDVVRQVPEDIILKLRAAYNGSQQSQNPEDIAAKLSAPFDRIA